MRGFFNLVRNNKIWSGIVGLLMVIGGAAYAPFVEIGRTAAQESIAAYCDANPSKEECKKEDKE